jgi:Rrf2 family protein
MSGPLNTQFSVAVHLLTVLAVEPEAVHSSDAIAGSVGANPVHVRRVLSPLRAARLIDSRPGAGGGSRLARPAADVTLADVWLAIHGDEPVLALHTTGDPECPVARQVQASLCTARRSATDALVAELRRTTLADVAAGVETSSAAALPTA